MTDDVLLKFLSKGLINVGGDDDKLGHLRQTAVDLAGIVAKTPAKASPFALVAFDPDVPPGDPTVVEVRNALRNRWATYVNTFAGTPVTVFRAILLDALIRACGNSEPLAAAFVASARNVLPYMEVGSEREVWAGIVGEIESNVEKWAEREWALPPSIGVPALNAESPSEKEIRISSKKVDISNLNKKFREAGGPSFYPPNRSSVQTGGNPHWPQNQPESWNYEFGKRSAEAVADAINQAIGGLSVEGIDLPGFSEDMKTVISEHLTTTLQAVSGATAGLQRRTNLLWWKEALFSPSVRISYREMSSFDAAVLMAFDVHRQIPTFSPASVAAFLWESVNALPMMDQGKKVPIRELLQETRDADVLDELRTEANKLVAAPSGRGSILGLIGHPEVEPRIEDHAFQAFVGVKPDTMLTLPDWSVWIFRELQAARATTEASTPKRRTPRRRTPRK